MPDTTPEVHFLRFRETGHREELARSLELVAGELMAIALRRVGNREEASDLVQTTFVTAIETADRFDAKARLFPWLRGILVNHARQRRRTRRRRRELPAADDLSTAPTPDPSDMTHRKLLLEQIHAQVKRLPPTYREVLDLYVSQGWDSAEIASHLDRPRSTIRTQLSRGLEKLRAALPSGLAIGAIAYLAMRHGAEESGSGAPTPNPTPRLLATGATLLAVTAATLLFVSWGEDPPPAPVADPVATSKDEKATPAPDPANTVASNTPTDRQPVADMGAVRVHLRWANSGKPAAGFSIRLNANFAYTPLLQAYRTWHEGRSDANGIVLFERVPPGPAHIILDDGTQRQANFIVGSTGVVEQHLSLTPTFVCNGVVVNQDGTPVPDAEVWFSSTGNRFTTGYPAGITGSDGTFVVYLFTPAETVWARKEGYAVSTMLRVSSSELVAPLRVRLAGRPSQLTGVVSNPEGKTVSGALVGIFPLPAANAKASPPSIYCRSGPAGKFSFGDLQPGRFVVIARFPGLASAISDPLALAPGERQSLRLKLTKGATVRGRIIYDKAQENNTGFLVNCDPQVKPRRPGMRSLLASTSVVGEDGSYLIQDARGGPAHLRVNQPGMVRAYEALTLVAGTDHRWDISLDPLVEIHGRIRDEHGHPVAGIQVQASPAELPWNPRQVRLADTDAKGRFVISRLQDRRYRLWLIDKVCPGGIPSMSKGPVTPGAAALEFVLPSTSRASAWIMGRLSPRTASLWRRENITIVSYTTSNAWPLPIDAESGAFRYGPLPPGTFDIQTRPNPTSGVPGCVLATVRVKSGKIHDLGELDPGTLQKVTLQLVREDQKAIVGGRVTILPEQVTAPPTFPLRNGRAETRLFPGLYSFWIVGGNFVEVKKNYVVRDHDPGVPRIRVRPARRCQLGLPVNREHSGGLLRLEILDAAGAVVFLKRAGLSQENAYSFEVGLPKGEYRVKGTTNWGGLAEGSFRVESLDDQPKKIKIPVK